jgi:phosphoglycolate phosphatase-like HAD superfamily hydrolase
MAIDLVLFDLEGTLIDVEKISHHREARRWNDYVANVGQTNVYAGVDALLAHLAKKSVKWAVVTNVPSKLAHPLLARHGLSPAHLVCFHDVPKGQHKPHPQMCNQTLTALGMAPSQAIGVGDQPNDARAFAAAGVPAYCAGWNTAAVQSPDWTATLTSPAQIVQMI